MLASPYFGLEKNKNTYDNIYNNTHTGNQIVFEV